MTGTAKCKTCGASLATPAPPVDETDRREAVLPGSIHKFGAAFAALKHEAGRLGLFATMQAMDKAQATFGDEATAALADRTQEGEVQP